MKFNTKYLIPVLLGILMGLGLFLRLFNLENLPQEMHRDEASIAYNAFALLKTGLGEHGEGPWPTVFEAYGDQKLPGLVYLTSFFLRFGHSVFYSRLGSALLASLLIWVVYLFVKELFKNTKLALLASLLVTFAPWHIFLARTIYEPIAALTVSTLGLYFLLKARKNAWWMFVSGFIFFFSFLTYNLPFLLIPLLIVISLWIYRKEYLAQSRVILGGGLLLTLVLWGASYLMTSSLSSGRMSTTIFSAPELVAQTQSFQDQAILGGLHHSIARAIISNPSFIVIKFLHGYLSSFDLGYLFFQGGNNPWHSLGVIKVGDFNPGLILPLLIGAWQVIKKIKNKAYQWLLMFVVISPIPNSLTVDAPVTNRLMDFYLGLLLLAAVGVLWLVANKHRLFIKILTGVLVLGYVFFFASFWLRYNYLHSQNLSDHWPEGIKEAVFETQKIAGNYDRIYIDLNQTPQHQFAYIYFLFYTQYNPALLISQSQEHQDFIFQTTWKFDPYQVKDMENIAGLSQEEKLALIPANGQKVLVVERVNKGAAYHDPLFLSHNNQGWANWQLIEIDKDDFDYMVNEIVGY